MKPSPMDYYNHCVKKGKKPSPAEYEMICKKILAKNKADALTPAKHK